MKFLVAPDKFKGSLSAQEAAGAIRQGLEQVFPHAEFELCPLADGGEGTLEAVLTTVGGERRSVRVEGPRGREIEAVWALLSDGSALVEAAQALSLSRNAPDPLDPCKASSRGLGQLVYEARRHGVTRIMIAVGGTATMDGGAGALEALGTRLLDDRGLPLPVGAEALRRLSRIDTTELEPYRGLDIQLLSDVDNPLLGETGAARTYGPQKGADPEMIEILERSLARWSTVLSTHYPNAASSRPGDGAAGGLGFGLRVALAAPIIPGSRFVLEKAGLETRLRAADVAVTGEGSIDHQTLHGKLPVELAKLGRSVGTPVIAIGGQVIPSPDGRRFPFPTLALHRHEGSAADTIRHARERLVEVAAELGRLLELGRGMGAG